MNINGDEVSIGDLIERFNMSKDCVDSLEYFLDATNSELEDISVYDKEGMYEYISSILEEMYDEYYMQITNIGYGYMAYMAYMVKEKEEFVKEAICDLNIEEDMGLTEIYSGIYVMVR